MCRGPGAEASLRHLTPPARSRGARSGLWHWSRAVLWTRAVGQEVVSGGPSQGGGRGGGALMLVDGVRLLPQEKSRVVGRSLSPESTGRLSRGGAVRLRVRGGLGSHGGGAGAGLRREGTARRGVAQGTASGMRH